MTFHVHAKKDQPLPIKGREVRFAVGTPTGQSSNAWLITTRKKGDIYVICQDNFSDSKVSLHASGKWRYAFSDSLAINRPDLVSPGSDRAIHKWNPPKGWKKQPILAFELHVPQSGLYLASPDRTDWKKNVIFIEPHQNSQMMTVVQLVIAPVGMHFDYGAAEGGTIADLQVTEQLHAMINVVFEEAALHNDSIIQLTNEIVNSEKLRNIAKEHHSAVLLPSGFNDLGTMFLMPLPLISLFNEELVLTKLTLTNYTLDTFIAPKLSELTQCNIPDISDKLEESTSLIDAFCLNSIFTNSYNKQAIPFGFFYLRRAETAFREFHFARIALSNYLKNKRENISLYFEALFHLETCIAQLWQALLQFKYSISKQSGKKEQIYKKGENSHCERINLLYNASRYAGDDNIPDKATIPVWITNTGIEGKNAAVSYDELFSVLNEVVEFANKIAYAKK